MIYLVLFCYCFRVIPILIMKNSFKVNTIIYVYWYIYIYTEKINFLHLYAHILWISHLIAYFAKFYIWSQTPKKKIIANNYIELKPNEFFCVHKLHKLISPKKKWLFWNQNANICRWLPAESNINDNVFSFLSLNIFTN